MTPLGDPALDPPMTCRVHPDDDPHDPAARRVIRISGRAGAWPWVNVTGEDAGYGLEHCHVAEWPMQHWLLVMAAFRHAELAGHGQPAADPATLTPDESARLFRAGYDPGK